MLTTTNGVPYPENNDPISSYPATLQGMAAKLDAGGWVGRFQTVAQNVANSTWTRLTFDSEWPSGGDVPVPPAADGITYAGGVFTVTKPGLWLIAATVECTPATNAGSTRLILRASSTGVIGVNGTNERARATVPVVGTRQVAVALNWPLRLNAGAAFDMAFHQDTGAAVATVAAADHATQLTAYRIAP